MRDALVREHAGAQERRRDAERGILPRDTDPTTVRELTIAWRQSLGENHDLHVATIRTWQWLLAAMFGEPVAARGSRMPSASPGRVPRSS